MCFLTSPDYAKKAVRKIKTLLFTLKRVLREPNMSVKFSKNRDEASALKTHDYKNNVHPDMKRSNITA